MFTPFMICGTFHHEDEENDPWSLSSTSTKSRRKDTKNPYSMRGLDTFSALLADLEERKRKIYSEIDARNISLVRFVYSNSNDCVPIVVKLKEKKQEDHLKTNNTDHIKDIHSEEATRVQERVESDENKKTDQKKRLLAWNNIKLKRWRRPSYYLPAVIILILLLLVFFGRSVAVLCTAIGWYMVPTIKGAVGSSSSKVPKIKKEYVRKMSRGNEISSPKGNISAGAFKSKSPPRQYCPLKSG